jgi:hypothetical protein
VALALLEELGEPLLTSTLILPGDEAPLTEGWEIQDRLDDPSRIDPRWRLLRHRADDRDRPDRLPPSWSAPGAGRWSRLAWNRLRILPPCILIQTIAIAALPVIFAITLHEAAHGYAARHFGDPTAWQAGAHQPIRCATSIRSAPSWCRGHSAAALAGRAHSCSAGPSRCRSISAAAPSQARHAVGGGGRAGGQSGDGLGWAGCCSSWRWAAACRQYYSVPLAKWPRPASTSMAC